MGHSQPAPVPQASPRTCWSSCCSSCATKWGENKTGVSPPKLRLHSLLPPTQTYISPHLPFPSLGWPSLILDPPLPALEPPSFHLGISRLPADLDTLPITPQPKGPQYPKERGRAPGGSDLLKGALVLYPLGTREDPAVAEGKVSGCPAAQCSKQPPRLLIHPGGEREVRAPKIGSPSQEVATAPWEPHRLTPICPPTFLAAP